jgi:hypothetical protein
MDAILVEAMSIEAIAKRIDMKAVDAAQILWAFATAGVHLDATLVDSLTQVVVKSEEMRPHDIVLILWALGTAKVLPTAELLSRLVPDAVRMSKDFTPQHISNLLWALVTFGTPPNLELFAAMSKQAVRRRQDFTPQAIANLLWALATAGVPMDAALVEAMTIEAIAKSEGMKAIDAAQIVWAFAIADVAPTAELVSSLLRHLQSDALSDRAAVQLHQFFLWNSLRPTPLDVSTVGALAFECKDRCIDFSSSAENIHASVFQNSVAQALTSMRVTFSEDTVLFDFGMTVDFRLSGRLSQVVIEADGPSHYFHELGPSVDAPRLNASTRFKHRVLQKLGWKVLFIPYFEWSRVSRQGQVDYLTSLLAPVQSRN